jgi:hypothetical protein
MTKARAADAASEPCSKDPCGSFRCPPQRGLKLKPSDNALSRVLAETLGAVGSEIAVR